MRIVGLDTNILVYDIGLAKQDSDFRKISAARELLASNPATRLLAPTQVFGELFNVLVRHGRERRQARASVQYYRDSLAEAETRSSTFTAALDLAVDHQLQFWDALILAACAEAGCSALLSEDMGDGFVWRGVTVVNPFAAGAERQLERLFRP